MRHSKKPPRSVERISHLFLSTQEPSKDGDVGSSRETRQPGQLKLSFGSKESAVGGNRHGNPSCLSGTGLSRPPLTLLDFLVDDEAADKTE